MTRYWTSDTHLGHRRIIELCDRPFADVEEMNREIIDRWNFIVQPDDEVWHLGDVALGTIAETLPLIGKLNGRKKLIVGNHDRVFPGTANRKMRERFGPEYAKLFDLGYYPLGCTTWLDMPHGRQEVAVSHFPYDGDSHDDEDRFRDFRLPDNGMPLIHGHTHVRKVITTSHKGTPQFHVGVDTWDFFPIPDAVLINHLAPFVGKDAA